ncbi:hypothetical protein FRAAL5818 [Frankia alni ACN14a]|uniref:Uncharacterized protein n=1 Tax=Frankia alni (strain DSM 45986 / CECT 9034 / ACN14a) TaxID=326424 RepID=Q0RDL8_FRAAA|nr:hypothetical protein FRAAL5818 [Frankia alni ACN14a]
MRASEAEEFLRLDRRAPVDAPPHAHPAPILGSDGPTSYPIVMATTILATDSEARGDT